MRILEENPPDGILLLATEMQKEDLQAFKQLNLPIVLLDSGFEMEKMNTVLINNTEGAYEAVRFLIDNGHDEIGYLHSAVWINNFDERREGFFKAINDSGIKINKKQIFNIGSTLESAYRDMCRIIESKAELPKAFFADNDIIAFGAMKAMRENGIRIPEDISIIGFDDMPFCEMMDPLLTTMKVSKQRMGRLAVRRLKEVIEGETDEIVKIQVLAELVERKSVLKK